MSPTTALLGARHPWADDEAVAVRYGLLLEEVLLRRTGPADRLDRLDGRAREDWSAHLARLGPRPAGALWLIDALEEAGLTGHGGGHFPVARKWRSVLGSSGELTVVANGSESETLSAKDATLLRQRPHLVLDGLHAAMETVGATAGVVWLHQADRYTRRVVTDAIAERSCHGLLEGPVRVVAGPDTYLAGESSAIVRGLSGGPVLPTYRGKRRTTPDPARPAFLVHNVETLARVASAARVCASDAVDTRLECFAPGPDTTLLTVLTPDARALIEVPRTHTLGESIAATVWGRELRPATVLLGGFGGMWAPWADVVDLPVNEPAARAERRTLGAGIVAPLTDEACGVAETARIVRYLADSSARQCGPCLFGLPALADSLELLANGSARRRELRQVADDLAAVRGRGACHHPDGAVRLVASALDTFADDFARHASGRPCGSLDRRFIPVPEVH